MRSKKRDTALVLVATPRSASSARSSASVISDRSATRDFNQSACASSGDLRPPRCGLGPGRPSARNACIHFTAVEGATSNTLACDRAERPFSTERINRLRKSSE